MSAPAKAPVSDHAKDLALRAAFKVMDSHPDPRCDKHQDGDPIQCGWKQAYAEMLDALWIGW